MQAPQSVRRERLQRAITAQLEQVERDELHRLMMLLPPADPRRESWMSVDRLSPQLSPVPLLLVHRWNGPLERLARRPHLPLCGELRVRLGAPAMVGLL